MSKENSLVTLTLNRQDALGYYEFAVHGSLKDIQSQLYLMLRDLKEGAEFPGSPVTSANIEKAQQAASRIRKELNKIDALSEEWRLLLKGVA